MLKQLWGYLQTAAREMDERNLSLIAAGVAFYAMLALFPALAAVIAIWGFFADPIIIYEQLVLLERFVPTDAFALIEAQVITLTSADDGTLGLASIISILAAMWTARSGVAALIRGLNTIHYAPTRSSLGSIATALALTLTLICTAIVAMITIIVFPIALAFLPLGSNLAVLFDIIRWLIVIAVAMFGIGLLYRFGPNLGKPNRPGWITPGAVAATIIWGVVSAGFSIYLSNFGNYNEVYGSIGAVIALLMWFYISAWVVLLGGAINAAITYHQGLSTSQTP
ncbi:MAG: YihY/virulence factor BrkB family protein [Litoreibacter sp.]